MRPKIHFTSKKNWINDPVGLTYFNGEYHIFYQYFPLGTMWGTMHWGHVTTQDFLNYKPQDIALFPSNIYDKNGVFSGSAYIKNNKLHLFYTGVEYLKSPKDNIHITKTGHEFRSTQLKIESNDGYTFNNFEDKKVLLLPILDSNLADEAHTRDPKIWDYKDEFYMILGTKIKNFKNKYQGKLLIYKSKDLDNFEYFTSFSKEGYGNMWECPDYFEIQNNGYLILSPENILNKDNLYQSHATIQKAYIDYKDKEFRFDDNFEFLDYGLDCYAPQTFLDKEGRRTLISWIRMPQKEFDNKNEYIGMLTMPRVITIKDNNLNYQIHPNISKNFYEVSNFDLEKIMKIDVDLQTGDYLNIGGYQITFDEQIIVDRSRCFVKELNTILKSPKINLKKVHLEIVIDQNVIEIFIDYGRYVMTNVVYNLLNEIDSNIQGIVYFTLDK